MLVSEIRWLFEALKRPLKDLYLIRPSVAFRQALEANLLSEIQRIHLTIFSKEEYPDRFLFFDTGGEWRIQWPVTLNVFSFTFYISQKNDPLRPMSVWQLYQDRVPAWIQSVIDLLQLNKFPELNALNLERDFDLVLPSDLATSNQFELPPTCQEYLHRLRTIKERCSAKGICAEGSVFADLIPTLGNFLLYP